MTNSILRGSNGRFITNRPKSVVPGRLYDFKGTIVRVKKLMKGGNYLVSFHKKLNGIAARTDLKLVDKTAVQRYLKNA